MTAPRLCGRPLCGQIAQGIALILLILLILLIGPPGLAQQPILDHILHGTGASAVLLDVAINRTLAQSGPAIAALPGSTLKPLVLQAALDAGIVRPGTTVECRGALTLAGRNLACTHPRAKTVFDARSALAYSCNTYFARLAEAMPTQLLRHALAGYGITTTLPLDTPGARALQVLGLAGPRTTPLQLARAYRLLALHPNSVVEAGLIDSVQFGMADNARVPGLVLAGKTGSASEPKQSWTHGWFAGIVYAAGHTPHSVLVVYVPQGSGADAATFAQRILMAIPQ